MCGIIFHLRLDGKTALKTLWKRYTKQKSRGQQGFGFVSIENNCIVDYVRTITEQEVLAQMKATPATGILFHHRYPTSTPNFAETAHPIRVSHASLKHDYYVIHNGIISNDSELKEKHDTLGYRYTTQIMQKYKSGGNILSSAKMWNDSESLAIELAIAIENDKSGIPDIEGSIAFLMLQTDKQTGKTKKIFWGRNSGSPLVIDTQKGHTIMIASEGMGKTVPVNMLGSLDFESLLLESKAFQVGETPETYSTMGYGASGYRIEGYSELEDSMYELEEEKADLLEKLHTEGDEIERAFILREIAELDRQLEKMAEKDYWEKEKNTETMSF